MKNWISKFCFLLSLFAATFCHSTESYFYVLKDPYPNTGLFAVFQTVLCFLDLYEQNSHQWNGFEVNFGVEGVYWTKMKGSNWWHYYFEPIQRPPKRPIRGIQYIDIFGLTKMRAREISRTLGHQLIEKYIKIHNTIKTEAENFYEKNLQNAFIIGVHYRGTDKIIETPRVSYDTVYEKIVTIMQETPKQNMKIFIATDEEAFICFMKDKFQNNIYYTNATRSMNSLPVHLHYNQDPYKNGKEALIDCLLLSKCNALVRTESHLSNTALMLNLDLVPHTLNSYRRQ